MFFTYVLVNITLNSVTIGCYERILVITADLVNNVVTKISLTRLKGLTSVPCKLKVDIKFTILNVLVRFTVGGPISRRSRRAISRRDARRVCEQGRRLERSRDFRRSRSESVRRSVCTEKRGKRTEGGNGEDWSGYGRGTKRARNWV